MPRTARKKSVTSLYHIVLRGINRQDIFEEPRDYDYFLHVLGKYKEICGYEIHAYCLMSNHIHLLLRVVEEDLDIIFRRIGASFVYWYNAKYDRTGHLFQDRFHSEVIEDERYYLTVVRYIHLNPVKAGLCKYPDEYPFSSYRHYWTNPLIESNLMFKITGKREFSLYHRETNDDRCLDIPEQKRGRITDDEALQTMQTLCGCISVSSFQKLPKKTKGSVIHELRNHGASIRQISRLTGVTIARIRKCENTGDGSLCFWLT